VGLQRQARLVRRAHVQELAQARDLQQPVDRAAGRHGDDEPARPRLDLVPFRGNAVEDVISGRGIVAAFGAKADAAEIARRARSGEPSAVGAFRGFGSALGEFLGPWIVRFAPTCLVFGGSITRAWDLFADAFQGSCPEASALRFCGPAARVDEGPLLGAALHAMRRQSETS